jgi:hypothetical protein
VICVDARHAKAALSLKVNKTDANDALGLAQIMRVGWYREVTVKGLDCQAVPTLLARPLPLRCGSLVNNLLLTGHSAGQAPFNPLR